MLAYKTRAAHVPIPHDDDFALSTSPTHPFPLVSSLIQNNSKLMTQTEPESLATFALLLKYPKDNTTKPQRHKRTTLTFFFKSVKIKAPGVV